MTYFHLRYYNESKTYGLQENRSVINFNSNRQGHGSIRGMNASTNVDTKPLHATKDREATRSLLESVRDTDHDFILYLLHSDIAPRTPVLNLFLAVSYPWQLSLLLLDIPVPSFVLKRVLLYFSHLHQVEHVRVLCNFALFSQEVIAEALTECVHASACCVASFQACSTASHVLLLCPLSAHVVRKRCNQAQTEHILRKKLNRFSVSPQ